jgi:DNA-binding CsgD family transcriptional regulator
MNGKRISPVASHSTFISPPELELILEKELAQLGIDHVVLIILDPLHNNLIKASFGFTQQQLAIYDRHQQHDVFLTHYIRHKMLGNLLYMQEMLPSQQINNEVFQDVIVPTMQLYHSYCGLTKLVDHHLLMLSSHSFQSLNLQQLTKLSHLWRFLTHWSNGWVSQKLVAHQWQKLELSAGPSNAHDSITLAELQVLELLTQGLDGSEIARRRGVAKETVRSQIKQLLHKTQCRHQNQLIARFYQNSLFA